MNVTLLYSLAWTTFLNFHRIQLISKLTGKLAQLLSHELLLLLYYEYDPMNVKGKRK